MHRHSGYLCFYYYHCVYTSTDGLLILIVSSSHWPGLIDISVFITITMSINTVIVIKPEISNKPCQWEDDTIKTNSPSADVSTQW
jgi:hypothetical protein